MSTGKITFLITAILLMAILAFSGCGLQNQIDSLKEDNQQQDGKIELIQQQIKTLEATIVLQIANMNELEQKLNNLQAAHQVLHDSYVAGNASLQQQVDELNAEIEDLIVEQASIQMAVQGNTTALAQLQLNTSIKEFVDPCGPSGGYDEVLMRTSTGALIAYFENGGNRHLTILKPGSYQTTDSQHCYFTVNAEGKVCENGNSASCH